MSAPGVYALGERRGAFVDVTYAELDEECNRFANVLASLDVHAGERVYILMPRDADLYAVALGTLKYRSLLRASCLTAKWIERSRIATFGIVDWLTRSWQ